VSRGHLVWLRPSVAAAIGWLGFVLLTERWRPWGDAVRLQYATDVNEFETIARAAPHFPSVRIQTPHADRWIPEWVVGEIHNLLPLGLHEAYSLVTFVTIGVTIAAVVTTLQRLQPGRTAAVLAVGVFVASAYPMRLLLEAPGMTTDALFVCGLALAVLAFEGVQPALLTVALVVATLGRQTGVPLALVVAVAVAIDPRWRRSRHWAAPLVLLAAVVTYAVPHELSKSFADTSGRGLIGMTVGGDWGLHAAAAHLGRCAIVLVVPAALLAVSWFRGRRAPLWGPLAFGLCVVAQGVALAPDWSHAEPRLVGLALPALAVAAAPGLGAARLRAGEAVAVAVGIALASLHHLYAYPAHSASAWAAFVAIGCLLCLSPLGADLLRRPAVDLSGS
jgi:hypothetical protein